MKYGTTQFSVLSYVKNHPNCSTKDVIWMDGQRRDSMRDVLKALEKKKAIIAKKPNKKSYRGATWKISAKGKRDFPIAKKEIKEYHNKLDRDIREAAKRYGLEFERI